MTLSLSKPTGQPYWPTLLIAGGPKAGKGWESALASGSPLVNGGYWVGIGEIRPDDYGRVPGANFQIVNNTSTYEEIATALSEIASLPTNVDPTLLIVDSATKLWELILADGQAKANARATRANGGTLPGYQIEISGDIWTDIRARWNLCMKCIRLHNGPVILTARIDSMYEIGAMGAPGSDRVKGEKGLPYDVDGIIELPERGKAYLNGVRSPIIQLSGREEFPNFSFDALWRRMGLAEGKIAARKHSETQVAA